MLTLSSVCFVDTRVVWEVVIFWAQFRANDEHSSMAQAHHCICTTSVSRSCVRGAMWLVPCEPPFPSGQCSDARTPL